MLRKLALLTAALTLSGLAIPLATAPAAAAPATIQAQCASGSYSLASPPYTTHGLINTINGIQYWHVFGPSGYIGSDVTGCSSSGAWLWNNPLYVSATSGDRCDPATSDIQYQFVGEFRQRVVSGPFYYYVYYRYWHVRRIFLVGNVFTWLYDHAELPSLSRSCETPGHRIL